MITHKSSIPLVFAAALACSADTPGISSPEGGNPAADKSSEIKVSLDVSGDPSTGLTRYTVLVDRLSTVNIRPDEDVTIRLPYGQHTFSMENLSVFPSPLWCTFRGPQSYAVINDETHSPRVTFLMDCRPLEGIGEVTLVFREPAISEKSDLSVTLTRLNGSPYSFFFIARAEAENSVAVPPGLYRVSASSAACNLSYVYLELDLARVVVRADATSKFSVSMECH